MFLEGEKKHVSRSIKVLGSQTGIPEGLKRNQKFQRQGGVNNFGFGGMGVEHFGISEGKVA